MLPSSLHDGTLCVLYCTDGMHVGSPDMNLYVLLLFYVHKTLFLCHPPQHLFSLSLFCNET